MITHSNKTIFFGEFLYQAMLNHKVPNDHGFTSPKSDGWKKMDITRNGKH